MIDGTLELPNILSIAQSLRGDDIYGKLGNYPKSMKSLTLEQRETWVRVLLKTLKCTEKMPQCSQIKCPTTSGILA
ncbi:MAG: hypothetical protein Ct9H300mP20_04670 [Gammaproteobacteria bacterium]|nr:MAG: hypothetical protein Ct9H300mP20_04670 [Gammaproteobacteria bacterium]